MKNFDLAELQLTHQTGKLNSLTILLIIPGCCVCFYKWK